MSRRVLLSHEILSLLRSFLRRSKGFDEFSVVGHFTVRKPIRLAGSRVKMREGYLRREGLYTAKATSTSLSRRLFLTLFYWGPVNGNLPLPLRRELESTFGILTRHGRYLKYLR